jgi:hypothetical protein
MLPLVMSRTGGTVAVVAILIGACSSGSSGERLPVTPCPSAIPEMGSVCTLAGEECGYAKSSDACGVACDCLGGAWTCGPTCLVEASVAVEEASADADTGASNDGGVEASDAP